jgi:Protein of unknown function (DUF1236)
MSLQKHIKCVAAVMLALGCVELRAQQIPPSADAAQKKQLENWQHTESGKMGKEEPSSQAEMPKPQGAFLNGALTALGAPTDVDTVPAKFSQKNANDDKLITVAYTFKNLSDDQRREISETLKAQPDSAGVNAEIGTELPFSVELRPVPDALTARVPQTKGYEYVKAGNRVLLVSPPTRIVVGVLGGG